MQERNLYSRIKSQINVCVLSFFYLFLGYSDRQNFLNDIGLVLRRFLGGQKDRKDEQTTTTKVGLCSHSRERYQRLHTKHRRTSQNLKGGSRKTLQTVTN